MSKSQGKPLIVEWSSPDRGDLEALAAQHTVAVRYEGCEMEILGRCAAPGRYRYAPVSLKSDRVHVRDSDRLWPWPGSTNPNTDPSLANFSNGDDSPLVNVGSHPSGAAKWGHHDMAGSLREWTLDGYDANWYAGAGQSCADCSAPSSGATRVSRGGCWSAGAEDIRAAVRSGDAATLRVQLNGVRCAR